jgi:dipeptidyl-peptidase III
MLDDVLTIHIFSDIMREFTLNSGQKTLEEPDDKKDSFQYFVDQFEDIRVLRYRLPDFNSLSLRRKKLVYYLSQAALAGRDILWDQNFRYNLLIRKTFEAIFEFYSGDRSSYDFKMFIIYLKRIFFANGIHHHYSNDKMKPGFSRTYFETLIGDIDSAKLPLLNGVRKDQLTSEISEILFDENLYGRKVERRSGADIISESAVNLYEGVSQEEVEAYYAERTDTSDPNPISLGLNSKVVKENGQVTEIVYRSGGLYGPAIDQIIFWLDKASKFAESEMQRDGIKLLINYYRTGDLKTWDEYNVLWVKDNKTGIDYNNGFIEVYSDPLGMKATWEAIVNYTDIEATKRSAIITANAQWFEDNSPLPAKYKKEKVTGVAAKVINIAMLGGDCYPSSPLGINLPNADWIRKEVGSKSVTLANITEAHEITSRGNGFLEEFTFSNDEIVRVNKYGSLSDALHTDLHECVGHASGKLAEGTDPNALKNYASTLEEARADLFALYYMIDRKIFDLGLLPEEDAARAAYDSYLRNGLLTQIVRIKPGKKIEEAHMRNRALISHWVYRRGKNENVVELLTSDGKSYVKINDYYKLRQLFGELLGEIQRIKSEGDYCAGKTLVEDYGINIDPGLHTEILDRYRKLNLAPYTGFVNPHLIPVFNQKGEIADVKVEYADDYLSQMIEYGKSYSFL